MFLKGSLVIVMQYFLCDSYFYLTFPDISERKAVSFVLYKGYFVDYRYMGKEMRNEQEHFIADLMNRFSQMIFSPFDVIGWRFGDALLKSWSLRLLH